MDNYPISDIVETAVSNLGKMAEVNTIVGKPIVTMDGTTIMPLSQVTFAFMAGGGEYGNTQQKHNTRADDNGGKFAGGTGGGATLTPVGFLVIDKSVVRVINSEEQSNASKLFEFAMSIIGKNKNDN